MSYRKGKQMNVEIFKTHIKDEQQATLLLSILRKNISDGLINLDFNGSNPLLKIETNREVSGIVQSLFKEQDIYCQKL